MWELQLAGRHVDTYPAVSALMVLLGIWGIGTVLAAWYPEKHDSRFLTVLVAVTVALAWLGFVVWSLLQITTSPGYGTDEVAFDQYAAQLLVHGTNPYVHTMGPAFGLFHVSPDGYTFLLNGQPVTSLSYPALSFLPYVPFLALGWSTQMAVVINVLAWGLGMVLAFVLLPRSVRPLAIVIGSLGIYTGYAVGGVTDALFVPLLIGAVYRWDDFATRRGIAGWRGPLLLGLALAVKQTPWLVLPFVAGGIGIDAARQEPLNAGGLALCRTIRRTRRGGLSRPQPPVHRSCAFGLALGGSDSHREPYCAGRAGFGRAEPLPRGRRWFDWRLLGSCDCTVCLTARGLPHDLPHAAGVGSGDAGANPLLFCSLFWELPDQCIARCASSGLHRGRFPAGESHCRWPTEVDMRRRRAHTTNGRCAKPTRVTSWSEDRVVGRGVASLALGGRLRSGCVRCGGRRSSRQRLPNGVTNHLGAHDGAARHHRRSGCHRG